MYFFTAAYFYWYKQEKADQLRPYLAGIVAPEMCSPTSEPMMVTMAVRIVNTNSIGNAIQI